MFSSLVQRLADGLLDIVGDIHGEIDAAKELIERLGYNLDGTHSDNRQLVFVGDLTDRGPNSPAVIAFVSKLVRNGSAQCVLGNHDLNILLGERKHDNHWFYGERWSLDGTEDFTPAVLADDDVRQATRSFFKSLPLVLERDDLRIVHACWDSTMADIARTSSDVVALYEGHVEAINRRLGSSDLDEIDRDLEHQNQNPVKVLSSGKERRIAEPFVSSGKLRYEERVPWWESYKDDAFCVFGHYSKYFDEAIITSHAMCIDFGVAKRWQERKSVGFNGRFRGKLAALRFPERVVVFDDGSVQELTSFPTGAFRNK